MAVKTEKMKMAVRTKTKKMTKEAVKMMKRRMKVAVKTEKMKMKERVKMRTRVTKMMKCIIYVAENDLCTVAKIQQTCSFVAISVLKYIP